MHLKSHPVVPVLLLYCAVFALSADASARATAKAADGPVAAATPSIDSILNGYIEALGGEAALKKQSTRVSLGTVEIPTERLHGTILIHEKAPNKTLQVVIVAGVAYRQGFDGTVGWTDDPQNGPQEISGAQLEEAARDADFFSPLHLRELYAKLSFVGMQKVGNEDAYAVEGALPQVEVPDKIYFSAKSGLLVRLVSLRHAADGPSVLQEDFGDYRAVDGVQEPFTIIQSGGSQGDMIVRIDQTRFDVELDDDEFAKPEFP